jgi:acyl-CoA thioester hydrolase
MRNDVAIAFENTNPPVAEISLTVNTYDIDIAGHVNNIVYVRWLEDMRNELFSQSFSLEKLLKVNHYPVVVSSEIKYKRQIKLFDKPLGKMFMQSYSHGLIVLKAEIIVDNTLAFVATQKCVFMNLNKNKMFTGHIRDLVGQN